MIMASLQLIPGIFLLFCHYTRGKFSKLRASDLATFYILGVESAIVIILLLLFFILSSSSIIASAINTSIFNWIMAGITLAIGILFFCRYYRSRSNSNTKLFIPRSLARNFQHRIEATKTRSDAFTLGLTSILPELIFTLPLFILSTIQISKLSANCFSHAVLTILFTLIAILPLLIIHILFSDHRTLADFIKFRFKHKQFFRYFIALWYLLIAIVIILEALS